MYRWEVVRTRQSKRSTTGTFTAYSASGTTLLQLKTLENAWKDNKRNLSRIPAGIYPLKERTDSEWNDRHKKKFGVDHIIGIMNVPGRDGIIIHEGNTDANTRGCLLLGLTSKPDFIGSSVKAMRQFYKICNSGFGVPEVITIREEFENGADNK